MKRILIITLFGNANFGNKLQNYAMQSYLNTLSQEIDVKTQKMKMGKDISNCLVRFLYSCYYYILNVKSSFSKREKKFIQFNNLINYTSNSITINSKNKIHEYDYYIYGSDQIWNPNGMGKFNLFLGLLTDNNIAYAASLSSDNVPKELAAKYNRGISNFKKISVREEKGKKIIEKITGRNDIEVLIDPTMLLTAEEWDKVSKRPEQLNSKKYILNYFLGSVSKERKDEIERIARDNNCDIINIMDKNDPLYASGPSEFLYLEKNAFLICTDSFHSSVFALLYDRPFIVFDREQKGIENMGSRLDTLINKFKLKNRRFNGKISQENLVHDYSEAYNILIEERKKSSRFLKEALDLGK